MGEREYKTKNGISVYYYPTDTLHSFHISLFVRAGSMHEHDGEYGVSHFFEHAAIRNVNKLRDGLLYAELDRLGVEFNASTFTEMIQFYTSGATKNLDFAEDVIIDVLKPIALDSTELAAERSRIKAEIRENDERTSLGAFTNGIVHGGTSLAKPITGSLGDVGRINLKSLESFRRRALCAENIFFYVTGNVGEKELLAFISKIDRANTEHGKMNVNVAPVSNYFGKRPREIYVKNADFTMARFTFDLDMTKIEMAEADLLYDVLLGGYSSEFFVELSEKRGLFYDISGAIERFCNIGTLSFSFEIKQNALYEATGRVAEILERLGRETLPEEKCMRAPYVDNAYLLLDDPRELGFTFGYDNHIMNAGYSGIDDRIKSYASVTPERICELAKMVFRRENLTLTVKGKKRGIDTTALERALEPLVR